MSVTNELKVGCLTLVVLGLVTVGGLSTLDGLWPGESYYTVDLVAPSANGLYAGTKVKLAGVEVGSVSDIQVDGNQARMKLQLRSEYQLPTDSHGELRASGLLGEYFIAVDLGSASTIIPDGGVLEFGEEPGDIDAVIKQFEGISEDVKAITKELRELAENDDNTDHIESTLANVDALSHELRLMAEQNRHDINAIVDSIRSLTDTLDDFGKEASNDIDVEMDKLHDATDKLDRALADVESITGKIDDGQGTIGALINDDTTIDALNDTIENVNEVVESFSGLHARVYYTGRFYFGSQPDDPAFFYGNPLAPNLDGGLGYSGSNTLGVQLIPQEDFWWLFEINDYPQGRLTETEYFYPEQGYAYTEWTREQNYRFTFQLEKRWYDFSFRLGVKENGGGIGMTYYALNDKLLLKGDLFDFSWGSYPAFDAAGLPNMRLAARWEPMQNLYFEAGAEQVLLGARYGYATGYVGGGFRFDDDDIKLILATLPLGL